MDQETKRKGFFSSLTAKMNFGRKEYREQIAQSGFEYAETLSTTPLTGNGVVGARTRQVIYAKYQQMMADPLVSGALRLHVTAALGGHETTGDVVFVETGADFKGNAQAEQLVSEMSKELAPIFNKVAMQVAYNAAGFGDAYVRLYPKKGVGIVDVLLDEQLLPPLVMPYEQGTTTRVVEVAMGPRIREKLVMDQVARAKMPRMIYTPQPLAMEKAWRSNVLEDDITKLPLMPSLVGGSFLADAEQQYNNYIAALMGLVGQRVLDSIDESLLTLEVSGMSEEQKQRFVSSIKKMFAKSKAIAEESVREGRPFLQRIRHLLAVSNNKQVMGVQGLNATGGSGSGRAGNIVIEDVMFHAKLLCGALGIDISMLGFADIMSGGLGEGGFFRTSAQSAERARVVRSALIECFNHIIDVHLLYKTGHTFPQNSRPWIINFYGTISALETERQKTALDSAQTGSTLLQAFQQIKELDLDEKATTLLLEKVFKIDSADAKVYAKALAEAAKRAAQKEAAQSGFGGGFGGEGGDAGGGFDPGNGEDTPPSQGKPQPVKVGGD